MKALEERGLFWWADEVITNDQLAPDNCVAGLLTIDEDGVTTLDLDGYLPSEDGPMSALANRPIPQERTIRGLLKTSSKQVLLFDLVRNGGRFATNGISHEVFNAWNCFFFDKGNPTNASTKFEKISVRLDGFEQWIGRNGISFQRTDEQFSAEYKKTKDLVYQLDGGELSIRFFLDGTMPLIMKGLEVSWKERTEVSLHFNEPINSSQAKAEYQYIEDLLILLSDSTYRLSWPWLSTGKDSSCRFYFPRRSADAAAKPPTFHECPTHFAQLRESFGDIWTAWRKKREKMGPAFYLYLGTRRGYKLYAEHRFVNLIWGLEAFHRREYESTSPTKLQNKIQRILDQISAKKDRAWLSKRLAHAHEPSLGERLFETLITLPLNLDETKLRAFSDRCAKLRNDISHFGGHRDVSVPDEELRDKSEALSVLYHLLLLNQIGVPEQRLKQWVFDGLQSFRIQTWLVKAELLDESILKPKS
jgi:hypothetical protein